MARPTQTKLFFVTVNPGETNQRKVELQHAQALSHAAKKAHLRKRNAVLAVSGRTATLQPLPQDDRGKTDARWELTHTLQSQSQNPRSALDASFRDPFDVFGVKNPPKYVFELIEFAIRCVWPWSCPSTANGASVTIKSYMQVIMESPMALHAAVSGQLGRISLFNTTAESRRMAVVERMKHQNRAFDRINDEIRQLENMPDRSPSEGILNAVAVLALYGTTTSATSLRDDHPLSPLATAQSLNIYGRMELVEEHTRGMHHLVRRKGGVDSVKEISTRDLIKSVDLVWASRTGNVPALTWNHPREVQALFHNDPRRTFDDAGQALHSRMGEGFGRIPGLVARQLQAIDRAARVTVALDQRLRNPDVELGCDTIVQGRNSAHHELLSTAPLIQEVEEDDGKHDSRSSCSHHRELLNREICRLVCRIYGNIVLFPMPPPTALKLHLSKDLLSQLLQLDPFDPEPTNTERAFFAWAMTLGGIAAFSTPYRMAYVRLIHGHFLLGDNVDIEMNGRPWQQVWAARCGQFLWWDHLLFEAGRRLWREVVEYGDEYLGEQLIRSARIALDSGD